MPTAREVLDTENTQLPLTEPYQACIGQVWPGFQVLLWGPKGSGKSTQTLLLAAALVPHAIAQGGTVMILAAEEGPGPGVQRRLRRVGVDHEDLIDHIRIEDYEGSIQSVKDKVQAHDVKWLVVDSISVIDPASKQARSFLQWCQKRDVGVILTAHARKTGHTYKGNSKVGHEVDAVLRTYRDEESGAFMIEERKSRALDEPAPDVDAPADLSEVGPSPSHEEVIRSNPDCSVGPDETQSEQCKAIMASLRAQGRVSPEQTNGEADEGETVDVEEMAPEDEEEGGGDAVTEEDIKSFLSDVQDAIE